MANKAREMDFDAWRRLAEQDPEGFERHRRRTLRAAIQRAPGRRRRRLEGLQWRVDLERRRASCPMAACVRLSNMMWESVAGDNGLLETLNHLGEGRRPPVARAGKVLPMQRPHS